MAGLIAAPPLQTGGKAAVPVFSLEVPELGMEVREHGSAALPSRYLNHLQIRVQRSPQEIPYGQIFARINGESANIIMSTRAAGDGILCDLDLNFRPGFLLQPGRNSVETWAQNIYSRYFYASFLLDVQDEPATQREIRTETQVSTPGARPPALRLLEPQGPIEGAASVRLAGTVETDSVTLRLTVLGKSVPVQPGDRAAGARGLRLERGRAHEFRFDQRVALPADKDTVEVTAEDSSGNRTRMLIPVVRGTHEAGERYAIVIGVSSYNDSRLNLRYAERDAEAIRNFLLDPKGGGLRPENVQYLVNRTATSANVRTALYTFLTKPQPDDLVFIYFAGHGAPNPRRMDNLYLLTADTDINNMGGTAVPMWEIETALERTVRGRVVTLVDACHSAGVGQGFQNLTNQGWTKLGYGQGRAVITASDINQYSQESDRWGGGHGVFTHFVLQGLAGEADSNHDRQITTGELFDYVRSQVQGATSGAQSPTALAGLARGLVLNKSSASAARWIPPQQRAGGAEK